MWGYEDLTRDLGFTEAVFLDDIKLVCKPELRACCNGRQCAKYGKNWVCPPGCGTLEQCRQKLNSFRCGLLVQSVTDLTPPVSPETYGELAKAHDLRVRELVEMLRPESGRLLALSYGGCNLCSICSYPEPCVHPGERMDSLSAFGIDVGELCGSAGLPFFFREDKLYLTALVLLEHK